MGSILAALLLGLSLSLGIVAGAEGRGQARGSFEPLGPCVNYYFWLWATEEINSWTVFSKIVYNCDASGGWRVA